MVKRILQYFRRETVLSAALICALLSFLLTPPSVIHLQGIDTTTLLMLFSLMTIVAGFRRMGALDAVSPETHPACDDAPRTFGGDGGAVLCTLNAGDE